MHRAQHLTFRESILVVDDTPANLRLLASLLADQGYQVRFAPNAKLALKSMQVKLPDLILLDVKLPDLDGYSVCRELKADNRTRNIPVIFLSVLEDPLDKVKAFRVGGADYISKPFQAEEVLARIETQLNTQRLQKQLIDQNLHLQQAVCSREKAESALEQQLQQMWLLQKVTEALRSPKDTQTILEYIVIKIEEIFKIDLCAIHIHLPFTIPENLLLAEYVNPRHVALGKIGFVLEDSVLIPEVLAHDRAVAIVDVYADPRLQSIQALYHQADIKSLLTVRTSYQNQPNGVITLQQCSQYRDWTVDEILLLEAIAAQIGIALAQAQSAEQEQKQLEALEYQNSILRQEICERRQINAALQASDAALSEFSSNLKHLHSLILTDFVSIEDLWANYLKTGCEILGFTSGVVGQVIVRKYKLLAVHTDLELLFPDLEFNLQDTYCNTVVQSRQTVCLQVDQLDQLPNCSIYQALKIESYLGTPIWVDGEIYGILCFLSTQIRRQGYDNHEKEMIELMAQSIGKFISADQIKTKRQQAEQEVQLLCNITQAITAASDFNQALHAALSTLCQATGWIYGEVWLPSADGSELQCSPVWYCHQEGQTPAAIAAVKRLRKNIEGVTFQPNEGIAGRVWQQLQLEWTLDTSGLIDNATFLTDGPSPYRFQLVNHYGIKARLGVPITVSSDHNQLGEAEASSLANSPPSSPANQPTVLAVLVFFTIEARQQDQRLIELVSAVATQLGAVLAQKQAEAELQALFTAMNDVVLVRDATGRCLKVASANPSFYQPAEQIIGKTLHETLPKSAADQVLQAIQASLATGRTVDLEYNVSLLNRNVCISTSISPLSQESVLIVARDVSDRKQIEAALAKRERYLAALVEVQRELLAFHEHQTQYTDILQLLGQVAAASRVYLYENCRDTNGRLLASQQTIWRAEGDQDSTQMLPKSLYEDYCPRWAEVLARGESLTGTVEAFPELERVLLQTQGVCSILVLPLIVNGEFWGFVGFDDCTKARTWDTLEISLLNMAASAIALHHERKLTEDALRCSAEREQATLRVIERMRQTLDIEQIFHTTTEELRQLLKCDRVLIYCFKSDWSGKCVAESVGNGWISVLQTMAEVPELTRVSTDHDDCLIRTWNSVDLTHDTYLQETQGGAYNRGVKYFCVDDVHQANFTACYLDLLHKLQAKAYLTVPIFQGHRLWGLLAVYQNSEARHWLPSEVHLVTHVSTQLGVALQQSDLLTQTQQQSADLEKAKDAAESANRAKTQFLASMSHELRTPLNSVLGFTQLISQEASLGSEYQEYLNIINRSGQHLLELINEILEVSKLEADRVSLQNSQLDLYGLLESIQEMLGVTAAGKQLNLSFIVAPEVPQYIIADKSKLRQILLNLLDNAIKFTQAGSVTLRVYHSSCTEIEPTQQQPNPPIATASTLRLHFEVEDTGFGIAIEEMDCLFEAFVQTEAGRQSNQGTGLGLMISRRFVELMGGKIQVRSLLGVGSVFEFDIPIHSVGCTPILPLLTSGEQTKTGLPLCRVLVVTVPQESEVLTRLLSTTDVIVDCATNSDELLAYWQMHQPHLIVVDPDLPDISQTLKTIQAEKTIQTDSLRPAIFALTDSPLEHVGKISELPYHNVLYRPLQAEELFAKLAEHLGVHCLYGAFEPFPLAPSLVPEVVSADLTVMSVEWIAKLHHAARGCSDRQVLQLIEQIPLIHLQLAKGLEELVYNFRFEELVKLTQSQMQ